MPWSMLGRKLRIMARGMSMLKWQKMAAALHEPVLPTRKVMGDKARGRRTARESNGISRGCPGNIGHRHTAHFI